MKKIIKALSLLLVVIMVAFSVAINSFAAEGTEKETTYVASTVEYGNTNGYVAKLGNKMVSVYNNEEHDLGKIAAPSVMDGDSPAFDDYYSFYIRGKTIFYKDNNNTINSIKLDGTDKKVIAQNVDALIGGYGSRIVVWNSSAKAVYLLNTKGKVVEEYNIPSNAVDSQKIYFKGKVYFMYRNNLTKAYVCDLYEKTCGDVEFSRSSNIVMTGKNNMYYLDNGNLMNIDKDNNVKVLETSVDRLYGASGKSTILFSKIDEKGEKVFYKKTSNNDTVRVTTMSSIKSYIKDCCLTEAIGVTSGVNVKGNTIFVVNCSYGTDHTTDLAIGVNNNDGSIRDFVVEYNSFSKINNIKADGNAVFFSRETEEDNYKLGYHVAVQTSSLVGFINTPTGLSVMEDDCCIRWDKIDMVTRYDVYRSTDGASWEKVADILGARNNSYKYDTATGAKYKVVAKKYLDGKYIYGDFSDTLTVK